VLRSAGAQAEQFPFYQATQRGKSNIRSLWEKGGKERGGKKRERLSAHQCQNKPTLTIVLFQITAPANARNRIFGWEKGGGRGGKRTFSPAARSSTFYLSRASDRRREAKQKGGRGKGKKKKGDPSPASRGMRIFFSPLSSLQCCPIDAGGEKEREGKREGEKRTLLPKFFPCFISFRFTKTCR